MSLEHDYAAVRFVSSDNFGDDTAGVKLEPRPGCCIICGTESESTLFAFYYTSDRERIPRAENGYTTNNYETAPQACVCEQCDRSAKIWIACCCCQAFFRVHVAPIFLGERRDGHPLVKVHERAPVFYAPEYAGRGLPKLLYCPVCCENSRHPAHPLKPFWAHSQQETA